MTPELYQKVLVEHAKHPRHFGPLEGATGSARGDNPLCGDELMVRVRAAGGRLEEVAFEGAGCAVCIGSASLMAVAASGLSLGEAPALMQRVFALIAGSGDAANMGDLTVLGGVARHPARVKCASLAWRALQAALSGEGTTVSTEL